MDEQLMTPAQVARRLQVTEHTVYDWLRKGRLRGVKLGRLWRVSGDDLEAFIGGSDGVAETLTPDEAAQSDAAWRAYLSGDNPGETLTEVRRALRRDARARLERHPAPRGATVPRQAARQEQDRILDALAQLEHDPFAMQVKPLQGRPEWSLRVGGYRVLLRIERDEHRLVVTRIGPRGDVHKR